MADWHCPPGDLARYAAGDLTPPALWSVETHVAACAACRAALTAELAPSPLLDDGWARLDAELDAPRPGRAERMLVRAGIPDHTARLLAATPVLRRSWLLSLTVVLLSAVAAAHLSGGDPGLPLLLICPLLPIIGVAVSFGSRADPTHDLAVVAPLHGFRLLLLRTSAVLTVTTGLSLLSGLALPGVGLRPFAWLVPALSLTVLSLLASSRLGPVGAPAAVGLGWVVAVLAAAQFPGGALFTAAGQAAVAGVGAAAGAVLVATRDHYDISPARPPHRRTP